MNSEDEELALLCVLLEDEERTTKKKKRKFWVRDIYKRRSELGVFDNLVRELSLGDREYYFK